MRQNRNYGKNAHFWYILTKKIVEGVPGMENNEFICPVETTLRRIGGKYKALILWHLMAGTLRYSELHRLMPNATDKMLTQQLRELEKDGMIRREVFPVVPPRTEYSLTEFGRSISPILEEMRRWGQGYCDGDAGRMKEQQ